MSKYIYELHMHTSESSKCAKASAEEMVKAYAGMGYSGIFVTDHFLNGNTTVPQNIDWEKRVSLFLKGYENAKKAGEEYGMEVFLGWEYCFEGTDFLTYGLSYEWLYKNPQCLDIGIKQYCRLVHENGGYIVHAHPFREKANAYSIDIIRLMPRDVDAVETYNAHSTDFQNSMAEKYADAYKLPKLCGSDNHTGAQGVFAGVEFNEKLISSENFIKKLKSSDYKLRRHA